MAKANITVNGEPFTATLANTESAHELAGLLPLTLRMDELNGNEKYAYLDQVLTTAAERPGTIQAGDLMLFGDDCLVLFYETFQTSYRYTRIGRIDDATGLAEAAGSGSVEVAWELA